MVTDVTPTVVGKNPPTAVAAAAPLARLVPKIETSCPGETGPCKKVAALTTPKAEMMGVDALMV